MLPAGAITEECVGELGRLLEKGDAIVDGGNSFWKDDVRRAAALAEKGIDYLDVGTSGGVFGLDRGYCLMIGGSPEAVRASSRSSARSPPARRRRALAATGTGTAEKGFLHCGPPARATS
jgi:6-phosphogluconate dehydrogenase